MWKHNGRSCWTCTPGGGRSSCGPGCLTACRPYASLRVAIGVDTELLDVSGDRLGLLVDIVYQIGSI